MLIYHPLMTPFGAGWMALTRSGDGHLFGADGGDGYSDNFDHDPDYNTFDGNDGWGDGTDIDEGWASGDGGISGAGPSSHGDGECYAWRG